MANGVVFFLYFWVLFDKIKSIEVYFLVVYFKFGVQVGGVLIKNKGQYIIDLAMDLFLVVIDFYLQGVQVNVRCIKVNCSVNVFEFIVLW